MTIYKHSKGTIYFILIIMIYLSFTNPAFSEDQKTETPEPTLYIELTDEFYRLLQNETQSGTRVYGKTASDEYLRQISVSTKFIVKTNLQIIKQQEKMIRRLKAIEGKLN
jgi:predicted ATPase